MSLRNAVRAALITLAADSEWWPPGDPVRFHNRLLDETGDGARELVSALMNVLGRDIAGRLPAAVITRRDWDAARRPVVSQLVTESGLDPGLVEWAVDTWAVALATIDEEMLQPARAPAPARRTGQVEPQAVPGWVRPVPGAPRRAPGAQQPIQRSASPQQGRGRNGLFTKWGVVQVPMFGPSHWTQRANLDQLTLWFIGVLAAGMLGIQALMMLRPSAKAGTHAAVAPPPAPRAAAAPVPGIAGATNAAVDPAMPVASVTVAAVDTPLVAAVGLSGAADTVRLADGRVVVGDVRVISEAHVYMIERESGLPYEFRQAAVRELVTRAGKIVHFARAPGWGDSPETTLIAMGVGGRYRVHREIRSVQGSESCQLGVDAQKGAPDTDEVFAHEPGSPRFTITSRPGVQGRLEADGRFITEELRGMRDGTSYTWQMEGRFTTTGFTAESTARTIGTVGWRQEQECRFVSVLTGQRHP